MIIDIEGIVHEANMYSQEFDKKIEPNGKSLSSIAGDELAKQAIKIIRRVLATGEKIFFPFQYGHEDILMLAMPFEKDLNLVLAIRADDEKTTTQRRAMLSHSEIICQRYRAKKLCKISGKFQYPGLTD